MEAAKRVAKNTGILYARMAITVFISLYSTRLILAALGVADFGLFNVVGGVISMLGFLNSSMAAATQRFMSFAQGAGDLEKVKRIFNMSSLLHWGIAVLVFLLLEGAGYFFFHGILNIAPDRVEVAKLIYQFMVISALFTVISVPYEAVITSHENMLVYAVMGVIEAVLKLGIAFYITYSSMDHLVMYGVLMAAMSIFLLIIKRIYCHRVYVECHLHIKQYFDKPLLKEMGGFAGWSLLASSSGMIANYGQTIVLNIFFGNLVNAAQGIALQICGQLAVFSNVIIKSINPVIDKKAGEKKTHTLQDISILSSKISYLSFVIVVVPFFLELPFLFSKWLPEIPEYSIIFTRLLLLRTAIEMLFVILGSSLGAIGEIKYFTILSSIINFMPLISSYILFKLMFPPEFLYISFTISSLMIGLVCIYYSKKYIRINIRYFLTEVIFKSLLVTAITISFVIIPLFLFQDGFLRFFIMVFISSISLVIFSWKISFNANELIVFNHIFKNQISKYFTKT